MRCINPVKIYKNLNPLIYPDGMTVPCGKCIHCKIQKRKEWALRLVHESPYHEHTMFLTLTYSDKQYAKYFNEPVYSLRKKHLQDFYKRLRKRLSKENRKLKQFSVGEYGGEKMRPHYHAILFGVGFDDIDKICESWDFCDWNNSTILSESFGEVVPETIEYVAKYVDKIQSEEKSIELYDQFNLERPFRFISQGIGEQYLYDNADQLKELYLTHNGYRRSIPRYYLNKLDLKVPHMNDSECELVESFTGIYCDLEAFYKTYNADEFFELECNIRDNKKAYEKRLKAGVNLYSRDKIKIPV